MQELSKDIRGAAEEKIIDTELHLRETSKKWASFVLEKNEGNALSLGLKISEAICNYLNEIKNTWKD